MTRLLCWCESFWPAIGGAEVLGAGLFLALRDLGHQVAVVTNRASLTAPARELYRGIPVHRLPFGLPFASGDLARVLALRDEVLRIKRGFRPDLVCAYQVEREALFYLHLSNAVPIPMLLTLHRTYTAAEVGSDTNRGKALRAAAWIATCSASVLGEPLRQFPELRPRASAIVNALAAPDLAPAPLPFDPPLLLCLGRLVPEKGFATALEALALLLPRFPGLRLLVAGDGPERPALGQQAAALGIAGAVDFLGWVDPARVTALLNLATAVVTPSIQYEGFGLVALQAAQMGRPVVSARVGGLEEVVREGQTGLLVGQGDAAAMARALAALLADPAYARRLGHAAHARAREAFRWERYVGEYDALVRRLAARPDLAETRRIR